MIAGASKIQRLLPRHFRIVDMAAAGHDMKTIAETLGLPVGSVGLILRSPLVQNELARKRQANTESEIMALDRDATLGKARSILEQASEAAASVHVELLENDDPSIKLRAADKILDRVFGKGGESGKPIAINITAEQVNLLTLALKESDHGRLPPAHSTTTPDPRTSPGPEQLYGCEGSDGATADGPEDEPGDVLSEADGGPIDV